MAISGTIDRSWNNRIEKARSPNGVRSRPADCSIGKTCAVELSASGRPSAMAAEGEKPTASQMIALTAAPHSTTCARPRPKMSCLSRHSRVGFSSSPTRKRSSAIPSSATPSFDSTLPTSPSPCGPISAPATRKPSTAPSPSLRNIRTKTSPAPSRMTASASTEPVMPEPAQPRQPPPQKATALRRGVPDRHGRARALRCQASPA